MDEGYAYQAMQHAKQQRMHSQPRAPPPQMRRAPPGQMLTSMDVGDLVAANVGVLNQSAGGQEWIVATVTRYSPSEGVFEIVDADEEAEKHVPFATKIHHSAAEDGAGASFPKFPSRNECFGRVSEHDDLLQGACGATGAKNSERGI